MNPLGWLSDKRWRITLFLALAAALNYADRSAMSAVLASVRSEFQVSDISLGLLGSLFLWSYAVCSPFAGNLADRYSRTKLVVWSLLAWSAVTGVMGLATGFTMLLVLRFILGVAECLFLPCAIALIAEYHGPATRARAMSFLSIGVNIGLVLGSTFSGFLAERFGWRSGFWALGAAGMLIAISAYLWLRSPDMAPPIPAGDEGSEPEVKRAGFWEAVAYLSRVPSYYALLIESMLSGMGLWIFFNWLPLYFKETYNMSLAQAGFAGTFMLQVAVILGIMTGGWISDRVSGQAPHRRMMLYGIFYLLAAPFLLLFLGKPQFTIVAAGISSFSFLRGIGQANDNATQCEIVPPQFRATGVGFMNAIATASGGCGVLMTGFLKREVGLNGIFAGISMAFIVAGIVLLSFYHFFMRRDIARAHEFGAREAVPVPR